MPTCRLSFVSLLLLPLAAVAADKQWWRGVIDVPGQPLDFAIALTSGTAAGEFTGTMDIPVQGAKGLALSNIRITAEEMRFTLAPPIAAEFLLKPGTDGDTALGEMRQHGAVIPVRMERTNEAGAQSVGPPRPQTPKAPFPYEVREVTFDVSDGTRLAGTLTVPVGAGPHPAVILITGSGAQDRDETLLGHRPFLVLADHLTRAGIAVLRTDDRGVGGSTGLLEAATGTESVADVRAAMKFLSGQPGIDARRLALLGHSEGGLIAPLAAVESPEVAAVVLLAGPALPGAKILSLQLAALRRAAGRSAGEIETELKVHARLLDALVRDVPEKELRELVEELVTLQLAAMGGVTPSADALEAGMAATILQLRAPRMRWFIEYDPRQTLAKVRCPALALYGERDLQVPAKDNAPEMEAALRGDAKRSVLVQTVPGVNHLFQPARTGEITEYATIQQTIAPAVLEEITTWLRARLAVDGSRSEGERR